MEITQEYLDKIKMYCRIDVGDEDDILKNIIIPSVQEQICFAIEKDATPEMFKDDFRFDLAVMKQVKEEYDYRGLTAGIERHPLANGVLNIIHQLRLRGDN